MTRQNPGGKSAYLQGYLLGFTGEVNISEALTDDEGIVRIKVGNGEVQSRLVEFIDPEELTPAKAVTALSSAGFTGCKFSVDLETNRLRVEPTDSNIQWIQIHGDVAAALQFGGCRFNEGKGCYIWASFNNDLKSVAETEQWSEDTVIENDSPRGVPVKHTTPGKRTGTQFVITDRLDSREAKQMLNGGTWISGTLETPDVYEPPTATSSVTTKIDVFTYSEVFDKNTNVEGDEAYVRERMYIGCVGKVIPTGGAGAWKDGEYTITAPDYKNEKGEDKASPRESDFTIAQWDQKQMSGVIVEDWESYDTDSVDPDPGP